MDVCAVCTVICGLRGLHFKRFRDLDETMPEWMDVFGEFMKCGIAVAGRCE